MKMKYIVAAITAMGGLSSPYVMATVFNQTVNLTQQSLVAGDVVDTTDAIGVVAPFGSTVGLALGNGGMEVNLTPGAQEYWVTGMHLNNGQAHDVGVGTQIKIQGNGPNSSVKGIDLSSGGQITGDQLRIEMDGTASNMTGIELSGQSQLTLGQNGAHIQLSNNNGGALTGLFVTGTSTVDLGRGTIIDARGTNVSNAGIVANVSNSNIQADALTIATNGTAIKVDSGSVNIDLGKGSQLASGDTAILLRTHRQSSNTLDADQLTIETMNDGAYGIGVHSGTYAIDLGKGSSITTHGRLANGITLIGYTPSSLKADELTIKTQGVNANGLEVRRGTVDLNKSQIVSEKGGAVLAQGDNGDAINIDIKNSSLASGGSYVVQSRFANAVVNLDNTDMTIDRQGREAYGLWGIQNGTINMSNSKLTAAEGTYGMLALSGSQINLTDRNVIDAHGYAMMVDGADSKINAEGVLTVIGDIGAQDQGTVAINAAADSYFKGGLLKTPDGVLNFKGSHTTWDMTKESTVNQLDFKGGQVNFAGQDRSQPFMNLSVAELSGSTAFNMRSDIVGGAGDRLSVTDSSAGDHLVSVQNQGSAQTNGSERLTMITTPDGTAQFTLRNKVELGGYLYDLQRDVNPNDWTLVGKKKEVSPGGDAAANSLAVAYLANFVENQSLIKRLGELRTGNGLNDAWARVYGGHLDAFGSGLLSGFDMDYRGIQFGADRQIELGQNNQVYLGAAFGLLDTDQDYRLQTGDKERKNGSGSLKSYSASVYGTYLTDHQVYADVVAKYARMKNKFDVLDTANEKVDGKAHHNVWSLSTEVGKRFSQATEQGQFYVTPQAQLTLSYLNGATVKNSNGLTVGVGNQRSVLARLGTEFGYEFKEVANPTTLYAKLGYLKEFSGNATYTLNTSQESHSFKGHWWQFGLGVTTQIKQHHNVYFDLESNQGNRFDQRQINLGYRYQF